MPHVDLSIRDPHGRAVVALRGELDLAGAPGVASHLIGRDPGAPANPRPCP